MYLDSSLVVDVRLNDENSGYRIVGKKEANSNPQRHFHNSWEILYIARGNRNFFYGHKTYNVVSGDFLCVEPGVLHRGINLMQAVSQSFLYNRRREQRSCVTARSTEDIFISKNVLTALSL